MNHEIQDELRKSFSAPSEDMSRAIMLEAGMNPNAVEKAITTGTGLVAYDLQAPGKNIYPVNTPFLKMIPRVGGGVGTATNWKVISAITGSGFDNTGWVPEGQRAGTMGYTTSSQSAAYATLGEEDQVSWEAISAGRTFEDVQATMSMRLLQKTKLKEESAIIFGNKSLQLGTPVAPTLSASGSGATLPAATYSVIVVALTMEGYRNSSVANGVATNRTVNGADGKTFTINGGSSNKSANATQVVTLGQTLFATATVIQGAVAYAWYVGTAGSEVLQTITTINSVAIKAPLASGTQAATVFAADYSTNANAFNGLVTTGFLSGSGAYVNSLPTGTAGTGTVLTASGKGSCNEIDTMMQSMWDNYQLGITMLAMNSQQLRDVTSRCLVGSSGAPLLQYTKDPDSGSEVGLTAGATIRFYFNPFLNGGAKVPVMIHPQIPAGTIMGWAADLPVQYQNNEVPNVAEMKVRRDYYAVDWAPTTRASMEGVYVEETLAVYAPQGVGLITNIAAG